MSAAKTLIELAKSLIPTMVPATHEERIRMFVKLADGMSSRDLSVWAAGAAAIVLQFPIEANRASVCAAAVEAGIRIGRRAR